MLACHTNDAVDDFTAAPGDAVLLFTASWCGACNRVKPRVLRLAAALGPGVRVAEVDADELTDLTVSFGVTKLPYFLVYRDSKRLAGFSVADADGAVGKLCDVLGRFVGTHRLAGGVHPRPLPPRDAESVQRCRAPRLSRLRRQQRRRPQEALPFPPSTCQ